jgi:predicted nucleic acid-binding protein
MNYLLDTCVISELIKKQPSLNTTTGSGLEMQHLTCCLIHFELSKGSSSWGRATLTS